MSKELPYFKFNVSEWLLGRISDENYRVQGIFLGCCCYYWHQETVLTRKKLNKTIGKTNAKLMIDLKFIIEVEGDIIITFLDEQYTELSVLREKRSNAGKKGGQAKPKQTLSQVKAEVKHLDIDIDKDKDIDNSKVYSKEIHECLKHCLVFFPLETRPSNKAIELKWLDTIDKLFRIEKIPLKTIYEVVKLTRADHFWKKNFLSIQKLRKRDKNDILYFTIFSEATKKNTSKSSTKVGTKNEFEKLI